MVAVGLRKVAAGIITACAIICFIPAVAMGLPIWILFWPPATVVMSWAWAADS